MFGEGEIDARSDKYKDTWDIMPLETLTYVILMKTTRLTRGSKDIKE